MGDELVLGVARVGRARHGGPEVDAAGHQACVGSASDRQGLRVVATGVVAIGVEQERNVRRVDRGMRLADVDLAPQRVAAARLLECVLDNNNSGTQ